MRFLAKSGVLGLFRLYDLFRAHFPDFRRKITQKMAFARPLGAKKRVQTPIFGGCSRNRKISVPEALFRGGDFGGFFSDSEGIFFKNREEFHVEKISFSAVFRAFFELIFDEKTA